MCRVTPFKSQTCQCRWMTVTRSCSPGVGFTTHPLHGYDSPSNIVGVKFTTAPANSCPDCDLRGQYDGNKTRMMIPRSNVAGVVARSGYTYTSYPGPGSGSGSGYNTYATDGRIGARGYVEDPKLCCNVM